MDELFVGVDVVMECVIMMLLVEFKEKGKIVFVVYYDLQIVEDYFDWILLFYLRKIVFGLMENVFMIENL